MLEPKLLYIQRTFMETCLELQRNNECVQRIFENVVQKRICRRSIRGIDWCWRLLSVVSLLDAESDDAYRRVETTTSSVKDLQFARLNGTSQSERTLPAGRW